MNVAQIIVAGTMAVIVTRWVIGFLAALDLRDARAEITRLQSINDGLEGQVKAGSHMIDALKARLASAEQAVSLLTKDIAERAEANVVAQDALKAERDAARKSGMLAAAEIVTFWMEGLEVAKFIRAAAEKGPQP